MKGGCLHLSSRVQVGDRAPARNQAGPPAQCKAVHCTCAGCLPPDCPQVEVNVTKSNKFAEEVGVEKEKVRWVWLPCRLQRRSEACGSSCGLLLLEPAYMPCCHR